MAGRFATALSACAVAVAAFAGCSSHAQPPDDGGSQEADFEQCAMSPAVDYMAGLQATSASGAYLVTLVSATTVPSPGAAPVDGAQSGDNTWVVSVTNAGDAGAGTPADVTMTAEKPWMPKHSHGDSTFPTVTPGDPGTFTVTKIDFFMLGYWSIPFDLQPASGAADKATFALCIRQ